MEKEFIPAILLGVSPSAMCGSIAVPAESGCAMRRENRAAKGTRRAAALLRRAAALGEASVKPQGHAVVEPRCDVLDAPAVSALASGLAPRVMGLAIGFAAHAR